MAPARSQRTEVWPAALASDQRPFGVRQPFVLAALQPDPDAMIQRLGVQGRDQSALPVGDAGGRQAFLDLFTGTDRRTPPRPRPILQRATC